MAEITKTKLIAGIFILLATIGTTYFVTIDDPVYYCEDLDVVGMCFKLSKINADGLQTRCYYNESELRKYKNCKTGWTEYKKTEFVGEEIDLIDVGFNLDFPTDKINVLKAKGISNPKISSCIKIDNFICKANIHEKGGINKDIEITYKSCTEYEINQSSGECLNWTDENQTICSNYEIINTTTSNCLNWKTLNQFEIQNELNEKANHLLSELANVFIQRNKPKETITLTGEVNLNIK